MLFLQDLKTLNAKLGAQKPKTFNVDVNASIEEQKKIIAVPPEKRVEVAATDNVSGNASSYRPRGARNFDQPGHGASPAP